MYETINRLKYCHHTGISNCARLLAQITNKVKIQKDMMSGFAVEWGQSSKESVLQDHKLNCRLSKIDQVSISLLFFWLWSSKLLKIAIIKTVSIIEICDDIYVNEYLYSYIFKYRVEFWYIEHRFACNIIDFVYWVEILTLNIPLYFNYHFYNNIPLPFIHKRISLQVQEKSMQRWKIRIEIYNKLKWIHFLMFAIIFQ